ncbi:acyl-CoA 6-desaturase-like isoform X2 [Anneissia japonica]|uniref:acyl-CoA 6-desaturase-like isoform X1 n=1 Tax=Anneissia japonica TaxID=1529436 RepID=UPI0014255569|nr:acyl-CoA 6-desaturase-like isoform X1 [Anneissia japonica]XP_033113408.1 acyl-CoA 6-desaturase-like isoform X2 [Anneissia japonica]
MMTGKEEASTGRPTGKTFTKEEVKQHGNNSNEKWLIIDNSVYDITRWIDRHPGGRRVIRHFAGQDGTDAYTAFHINKEVTKNFLKHLLIGHLAPDQQDNDPITEDFRALRKTVEGMGLFEANLPFYAAHLSHIVILQLVAWLWMHYFGSGWASYLFVAILMTTAQAQAGWLQHDFGHLSVCKTSSANHVWHKIVQGGIKAASACWWNYRHFQHHAKPNVIAKDPDVDMPYLFVLGDYVPVQWAKKKRGILPYNFQQNYFFLIFPPLLLPLYFHFENAVFMIRKRTYVDIGMAAIFFTLLFSMYTPLLGAWGTFKLYMFVRFLESHWFVWVTQMNHIPMQVDKEQNSDWLTSQLVATCNVEHSFFNDWFTGHLNYQIEHHLFPTMPRHNFIKVQPLVKSLCAKHHIEYQSKTLFQAFGDIVRSLKKSGQIWYDTYHNLG